MNFKLVYQYFLIIGFVGHLISCEDKIEIPGGNPQKFDLIYMPAAARNPNVVILKMADSVQNLVFGANFGGFGYPADDINIHFEVNASMVDSFNRTNKTNYPLLPASNYTLSKTTAIISKGKISTEPLHIGINPKNNLTLFKYYLLPVSISGVDNDYQVNQKLRTAYFVVQPSLDFADYPNFDRLNWRALGVSTQEPGEGSVNGGLGTSAIDNNLVSFWHTQWIGGFGAPPHWIAIDMGETHELHGLSIYGRQSNHMGKPKNVSISVSMNGADWEDVGSLQLANINKEQRFFISNMRETRYFKITILSTYGDVQFTHLAEVNAF